MPLDVQYIYAQSVLIHFLRLGDASLLFEVNHVPFR
jgi:hypothetical protein